MDVSLTQKKCVPCENWVPPLTKDKIDSLMKQLKLEWVVSDDLKKIKHEFKFKNFKQAMEFVNKIAEIAEAEGHHPDIYIYYNRVVIELTTHNIGGLSENDYILAAKVENLS